MASRRSTLRCASCRATYWSDDAHRCEARRWRKIGPHEYTLRMGPIAVEVTRWGPLEPARDEWGYRAVMRAKFGGVEIAHGHDEDKGAPLAQCQADAIAAVERWRDGIR